MYAIRTIGKLDFSCISKTEEELEIKIDKAYWAWRGTQPKDIAPKLTKENDFMRHKQRVKLTVEKL